MPSTNGNPNPYHLRLFLAATAATHRHVIVEPGDTYHDERLELRVTNPARRGEPAVLSVRGRQLELTLPFQQQVDIKNRIVVDCLCLL